MAHLKMTADIKGSRELTPPLLVADVVIHPAPVMAMVVVEGAEVAQTRSSYHHPRCDDNFRARHNNNQSKL